MLLTLSTTQEPATDLGFLLHKNPDRVHTTERTFGTVTVVEWNHARPAGTSSARSALRTTR
jgi:hypothetical protein